MTKMPRQLSVIEVARQIRETVQETPRTFSSPLTPSRKLWPTGWRHLTLYELCVPVALLRLQPSGRYKAEGRTGTGDTIAAMTCDNCASDRLATRVLPEHRTDALGIPGGTLLGIAQELYCKDCGERLGVSYPNLDGIVAALALARAQHPRRFGGVELRFMRKALNWTARELAAHLTVREETVSRWEHDREPIGTSSEKLLRLMVTELLGDDAPAVAVDRRRILLEMKLEPAVYGRHVPPRLKSVELRRNRKRQRAYALA